MRDRCAKYYVRLIDFNKHTPRMKWVPCYHSMVRPQSADRGDCHEILNVYANTLNKQWQDSRPGVVFHFQVQVLCYEHFTKVGVLQKPRNWPVSFEHSCICKSEYYEGKLQGWITFAFAVWNFGSCYHNLITKTVRLGGLVVIVLTI